MFLRRVLLILLLAMLAASVILGAVALLIGDAQLIVVLIVGAASVALTAGLMLPLTLLTTRPRFRAGGIALMLLCLLLMPCILGIFGVEFSGLYIYGVQDLLGGAIGILLLLGVPSACGLLLVKYRWATTAAWTLAGSALLTLPFCMAGLVGEYWGRSTGRWDRWPETVLICGMMSYGLGAVCSFLLVNVGCGDRRIFRWPAVALTLGTLFAILAAIFTESTTQSLGKVLFSSVILCVILAHANLLLMIRLRGDQRWLAWGTLACSGSFGALIIGLIVNEGPETLARVAFIPAIAAGCGSIAVIVLAFFNRKTNLQEHVLVSTPMVDIQLTCPRCGSAQTLAVGESVCKVCELQISIKVTEPRCPGCGYLLYQLTSRNCPECGALVRPDASEIASAGHAFPADPGPVQPVNP